MSAALFDARLLAFNLLPSLTLHPSRHAAFDAPAQPVPEACAAAWHRHWSAAILQRLGVYDRPVTDAQRPELALALLPPDRLARVARHMGAVRCAAHLRRVIAGAEVRALAAALGTDVLDFARGAALDAWSRPAAQDDGPPDALAARVEQEGVSALRAVFQAAGPELGLRAELRLADGVDVGTDVCPAPLELALNVLERIEPTWHSSFPAAR